MYSSANLAVFRWTSMINWNGVIIRRSYPAYVICTLALSLSLSVFSASWVIPFVLMFSLLGKIHQSINVLLGHTEWMSNTFEFLILCTPAQQTLYAILFYSMLGPAAHFAYVHTGSLPRTERLNFKTSAFISYYSRTSFFPFFLSFFLSFYALFT
jgi:hypothetical protein